MRESSAATNRDLQRAIGQGHFREDLYYRLNVFAIQLPPLRDRRDDILPLSEAFLAEIGRGIGRPPAGISHDARRLLIDYHWPGNARELRNILERAAILCEGGLITAEHLSLKVAPRAVAATLGGGCRRRRRCAAGAARRLVLDGARDDRAGASARAIQQVEGEDPRVDASAAVRSPAAVRTRLIADCRMLIASRRD
jgi:DNA-binding NtrC family response regulator